MSMINKRASTLLAVTAIAATGASAAVDIVNFHGQGKLILNTNAPTGGGSVAFKITHSDTQAGTYTDSGVAFANVTAASNQAIDVNVDRFKRFVKVDYTLSGGATGITAAATLVGKQQEI